MFPSSFCSQRFPFRRFLAFWCCAWLFASGLAASGAAAIIGEPVGTMHRVLVLNSYHQKNFWSDRELRGVVGVLQKEISDLVFYVECLDVKRELQPDQADTFLAFILRKYRGVHFDLIVTLDDAALELVLAHRSELGPDVPIVFGGVNNYRPDKFVGVRHITGVAEERDFTRNLNLLLQLRPGTRTVYVISDSSEASKGFYAAFQRIEPRFTDRLRFVTWDKWTAAELLQLVASVPSSDAILLLNYSLDSSGMVLAEDPRFNRALAAQASAPVILTSEPVHGIKPDNTWEESVWQGIGGYMLSGEGHGEAVGALAVRVLRGEEAEKIPVVTTSPTHLAFDYPQLVRHHIDVAALPPGAMLFNRPTSFFEDHRGLVLSTVGVILLLTTTIVILLFNNIHRRRAEHALRQSTQRLEVLLAAVDQATELIALLFANGKIYYANPAFRRSLQQTDSEPLLACDELWRNAAAPLPFATVAAHAVATGRWHQQVSLPQPDQSARLLEVIVTPIQSGADHLPRFLLIAQDVTQSARLEEQVRLSQKMDAIGTLASGIAHDFNNILTAIVGNTELALSELAPDHPAAELLQNLRIASDRATGLVRQILTFSRHTPPRREVLCLTATLSELLKFLRATAPAAITLRHTVIASPLIKADSTQIYQVLLNLCTNAIQALGSGPGLIELVEDTVEVGPDLIAVHPELSPGPHLRLSISDDGCGMAPEVARRIFEPFFTTKSSGQGTGLGLAVVHGILKNHHAVITVYSALGKGTVFHLYFPTVASVSVPAPVDGSAHPLPLGHGQHVILVDDETAVIRVTTKLLQGLGYRVTAFNQPAAALAHVCREGGDVLITDFSMPDMGALELVAKIRPFAPNLPVIIISGYISETDRAQAAQLAIRQIVDKPINRSALAHALIRVFTPAAPPTG